jgi:hypothetical protein
MEQLKLIADWDSFLVKIEKQLEKSQELIAKERATRTVSDLRSIQAEINDWSTECHKLLKESFNEQSNKFEKSFRVARHRGFNIPGTKRDIFQDVKEEFQNLKAKQRDLFGTKKILSISDAIIKSELNDIRDRQNYSTEEKLDLVIQKLYDVYDTNYYPIREILSGNGVVSRRDHEERDLGIFLESKGLITITNSELGIYGQLTLEGSLQVENQRKSYKESYNDINDSTTEINKKIDQVIFELRKLGLGQEIIYNEIEELKEVYVKVNNKKTWAQTLKGKLLDIALAQALDKDTLKFIYEQLTSHQFRLP